jgi:hypothetical protein
MLPMQFKPSFSFRAVQSISDLSERETLSLILIFENTVLKRIFGFKGAEVTGGWRKLLNQELH